MCKRGDIYNVNFGNRNNTHKQCGCRPALIISNNKANSNSPIVTVIPLTTKTWKKPYMPTHIQIPLGTASGLVKQSMAIAEQVESIDKTALINKIGELDDEVLMGQITVALQVQIGVFEEYN